MTLSRRGILRCLAGIIAAPAIVRADALMRVVAPKEPDFFWRGIPVRVGDMFDPIGDIERRFGALKMQRSLWVVRWQEMAEQFKPTSPGALQAWEGMRNLPLLAATAA